MKKIIKIIDYLIMKLSNLKGSILKKYMKECEHLSFSDENYAKGDAKLISERLSELVKSAIWAIGPEIEMGADILGWINGKLEDLLKDGVSEVDVVQGSALAEFIRQNQKSGKYMEVTSAELNAINSSVINIAFDNNQNIIDGQMIRSCGGISSQTDAQFKGQPILKIKITD